jgi:soluble lytic murein transglycosylase-like protein
MKREDVKLLIMGVFLSVLVLFLALGMSYVEIGNQSIAMQMDRVQMKSKISLLQQENKVLSAEVEGGKKLYEKYEMLDQLISLSQLDNSKIERALEIAADTPLNFKESLILLSYAEKFNVQPSLILAVIKKESNFNGTLVGTHRDRGFMQIIPSTEKWLASVFGKELGLQYDPNLIFTPEYNLGLGIRYIADLLGEHSDPHRALSEYNRGAGKLAAYYAINKTYETGYSKLVVSQEKQFEQYNK